MDRPFFNGRETRLILQILQMFYDLKDFVCQLVDCVHILRFISERFTFFDMDYVR